MDNFPSNSQNVVGNKVKKEDPPEKNIQKITTGEVVKKPTSLGKRFRNLFFGGEAKGAFKYVTQDVLLPALKNTVVDATSRGVERMIYGDSTPARRRTMTDYSRSRISYNSPADRYSRGRAPGAMLPDQPPYSPRRGSRDAGEIILVSREEAEMVLESMQDIVEKFDAVSIADLHELVGLPTTYVDNNWGWTNLAYADIRQTREGYVLELPQVEPIK